MKILSFALVMLLGAAISSADEKTEPALGFTLLVNGKKVAVEPGKEVVLKGKFENPKVKLIPDTSRQFTYAGLNFKYPAGFSFEADFTVPGLKIWSLDGNDLIIMIYQKDDEVTARDLAQNMVTQYGKLAGKLEKVSHKFNGTTYKGWRIKANIAGVTLLQDVLTIPTKTGSRLMLLQDMGDKDKISNKEAKLVHQLLDTTFKH